MTSVRRSLGWVLLSSNGTALVYLAVNIALARLLEPQEVGIFSITAVLVSIAHLFRNFGVGAYLQQAKDLTRENVGAALGVSLTSSWLIAAAVYALSGPAAAFYGQDGIQEVMKVLALGFAFIPFSAITHSLLTRDFRAKEQALVSVFGTLTYSTTVLTLAYLGFSYMSMAWANLANIIVTAIAYLPFRPAIVPWLPSFRGWGKVVNFGAGATLGSSLKALDEGLPELVLGKLSGPHDVGLLSRAVGTTGMLDRLIGPAVNYAVLPYLARTHHAGEKLDALLARGSAYITCLMWPAFLGTAIFAEPLVGVLFGAKWLDAAPLVQLTCLMFALLTPFSFLGSAYAAIGRPYLTSIPSIASLSLRGAAFAWIYDGTLNSFGWALVCAATIMVPVNALMQRHVFQLGFRRFLGSLGCSLRVTAWCAAAIAMSAWSSATWPDLAKLALIGIVLPSTWLVTVWLTLHPFRNDLENVLRRSPWLSRQLRV